MQQGFVKCLPKHLNSQRYSNILVPEDIRNSQVSLDNSQLTVTDSQVRRMTTSATVTCDWNDFSDAESLVFDETREESEHEVVSTVVAESSSDMKEEFGKIFFVGAKFRSLDELRDKAQALGKEFNCPINTARSSKNSYIILQCRPGGTYRKAKKVEADAEREESSQSMCCIENYTRNGLAELSE